MIKRYIRLFTLLLALGAALAVYLWDAGLLFGGAVLGATFI